MVSVNITRRLIVCGSVCCTMLLHRNTSDRKRCFFTRHVFYRCDIYVPVSVLFVLTDGQCFQSCWDVLIGVHMARGDILIGLLCGSQLSQQCCHSRRKPHCWSESRSWALSGGLAKQAAIDALL